MKTFAKLKSKEPSADYILNVSKKVIQIKEHGLKRVVMLCASALIKNTPKVSKNFHSNEINQDQYVIINSFRLDHIRPHLYI